MSGKEYYHRLSFQEREEISRMLAKETSFREIGRCLNRSASTISREVSQPLLGRIDYRAVVADKRAKRKRRKQGRKIKLDSNLKLRRYVLKRLRLYWSPRQIAEKMKMDYPDDNSMRISPETIYSYIYIQPKGELKRRLIAALRRQHKYRYRKNRKHKGRLMNIPALVSIDERPQEVEGRIIPGHWEGDLLMGKFRQSSLGSLVERTSRKLILIPLKSSDHITVTRAFSGEMNKIPEDLRRTMTYDRGGEMSSHQWLTRKTKVKVYFAHSKSPWERGTNENTNGLVRQFFPKKITDFSKVTKREIKRAERLINQRPRKVLNWMTPEETFKELVLR